MDFSPDTASMVSFCESRNQTEREKSRFTSQLKDFPHTFQLQNEDSIGNNQIKRLHSGLKSALDVGYKTDLETARGRNLLAYLLHRLDRDDEALEELDMVLDIEGQHNNLVTLANKAVILWRQHSLSSADEVVETLQKIQASDEDFKYLVVKAKAELAFTYTRLGPRFGSQAISLFGEVLPEAKEPEKWLWKFGLALTLRRRLRAQPYTITPTPSPETINEMVTVLQIFLEVARNASCQNLQAKTYAEIAMLLNMVWKSTARDEFWKFAGISLEKACEKALELDDNDNSVLCKCGRIFRYIRRADESCKLLEKALSIRPTSTGHHHLALTYKFLATDEKYKYQTKVPGYYRQLERQSFRGGHTRSYHGQPRVDETFTQQFEHMSLGNARNAPGTVSGTPPLSLNRDVRMMQKVYKSTPKGVTKFSRDDKFVSQILHHLKQSVAVSEGENTRALYDLGIMHKALNELKDAMGCLQKVEKNPNQMFVTDEVNMYEQMGLIKRELAESETNETRKQQLMKDSESMLLMALNAASKIFATSPGMKESLGEVWHSFPTLLQIVEESDKNPHQKLENKAKLFQLIKDHKQSLNLLKRIRQMDPNKVQDPEHLKLWIEEYVAMRQFEDALGFIALVEFTPQSTDTMHLFEDEHFVLKIYLHAARQALLGNGRIAKPHFRNVFQETAVRNAEVTSSSEDTDASEDSREEEETWDVMILHEDCSREKAIAMAEILHTFCGLRVPIMDRDLLPNRLELEGVLRMMRRSKLVVVMAGGPVSSELRYYIHYVAKRPSTVTLLVDGNHVPEMLKRHRSMACPEEVFTLSDQSQEMGVSAVDALCKVFSFMVGVDMDQLEVDIAST
ncbi:uncharacterized protein [Littorina saxatilis]|uniref:Uncharacterized protein n=1 Tax=Littorina saxatilis TaxID=31220 RepID=A0AAN9B416_9CAEN